METICFFEDDHCKNFLPLNLTRPVDDFRCGVLTLREKWLNDLNIQKYTRYLKDHRTHLFNSSIEKEVHTVFWINPRVLPDQHICSNILFLNENECLVIDKLVVAAKVSPEQSRDWIKNKPAFDSLKKLSLNRDPCILNESWDLLSQNGHEIRNDLNRFAEPGEIKSEIPGHCFRSGENRLVLGKNCIIEPGVVFITNEGPVYLGDDVSIMANSVIRGPVAICDGATIKTGAKVYGDTSIGPVCKVGGEVVNCIFHSYANKAHEGFTGDSIFGQWTNLGADTNTSNMKNNYSKVSVFDYNSGEKNQTGLQFLGTIMGDHSKTAINTMLNTGTICGVSSNIFNTGFPPKLIKSFRWNSDNGEVTYTFAKAVETMGIMMARRNVEITDDYTAMMKAIFDIENQDNGR